MRAVFSLPWIPPHASVFERGDPSFGAVAGHRPLSSSRWLRARRASVLRGVPSALGAWIKQGARGAHEGPNRADTAERQELAPPPQIDRILREQREILKRGQPLREGAAVKLRFISAEKAHLSLTLLDRCLPVRKPRPSASV